MRQSEGWAAGSGAQAQVEAHPAPNPLDRLLAPTTRKAFFADHHEQQPLFCGSSEPRSYDGLLTLAAVDAVVASADLRHDMLRLVAGGDPVDPSRYISPDGRVLPAALAEAYLRGATVVLPQLHRSVAAIADFCSALEGEFSAAVQANAYLTPAAAQGFEPHYDQHDVFILQIHGTKTWRLYGTPRAAAGGTPFERGRHEPGAVSAEYTLQPGDCLYIPRGLMHEAANEGSEPSLHLTIGVLPKRWCDLVLDAVAALVRDDAAFHRALPPGFATRRDAAQLAEQHFAPLLAAVASGTRLDQALERAARDFLHERRPNVAGVLASPRPEGPLRRRPLVLWRATRDASDLILTGPGGDLRFSGSDEAALTQALSGEAFDPRLLAAPDPARLVDRLWANGYLEQAPEPVL